MARSAEAISVFISRFLQSIKRRRVRAESNVRTADINPEVHACIGNPQAADKFRTTPMICDASALRGNESPALLRAASCQNGMRCGNARGVQPRGKLRVIERT